MPKPKLVSTAVHVALIDEAEPARIALARLLSSAGFQLAAFASPEEFLLSANDRRFDCLVLDLYLPFGRGFHLLRRLRRTGDRTPIVCLVAGHDAVQWKHVRASGVSCLARPADDVALFKAVGRAAHSDSPA